MWSGTLQTNVNKIEVLQKKAVQAITKASYNVHTNNYFIDKGILITYEMQISKIFYESLLK